MGRDTGRGGHAVFSVAVRDSPTGKLVSVSGLVRHFTWTSGGRTFQAEEEQVPMP